MIALAGKMKQGRVLLMVAVGVVMLPTLGIARATIAKVMVVNTVVKMRPEEYLWYCNTDLPVLLYQIYSIGDRWFGPGQ